MVSTTDYKHSYLFDKDLAAHIIYAEAKHFAAECSLHGPSEAELQSLARKLSWLVDKDLNWTDVDLIVGYCLELRQISAGTHPLLGISRSGSVDNTEQVTSWTTVPLFGEIGFMVAGVPTRWELAA